MDGWDGSGALGWDSARRVAFVFSRFAFALYHYLFFSRPLSFWRAEATWILTD